MRSLKSRKKKTTSKNFREQPNNWLFKSWYISSTQKRLFQSVLIFVEFRCWNDVASLVKQFYYLQNPFRFTKKRFKKKKLENVCPLFLCHQWNYKQKRLFLAQKSTMMIFSDCKKCGSTLRLMFTVWIWWNHNKKRVQYRYEWMKMNEWKSIIMNSERKKNWISNRIVFFFFGTKSILGLKSQKKGISLVHFLFRNARKKSGRWRRVWWLPWNVAFQISTIYSLSSFRRMNWMVFDFFCKYNIGSKFEVSILICFVTHFMKEQYRDIVLHGSDNNMPRKVRAIQYT